MQRLNPIQAIKIFSLAIALLVLLLTAPDADAKEVSKSEQLCIQGSKKCCSGDFEGAISDYTAALRLDPKNSYIFYDRGYAKSRLNDDLAAIEDYSKAIEISPKEPRNYINRGYSLCMTGDFKRAILNFDTALSLKPFFVDDAYRLRAWAKLKTKDYSGAKSDYDAILKLNPTDAI